MKKRIMLICAAGMSTSLLVTKMEKAAQEQGANVEVFALPLNAGKKEIANVDCVLLGPQVRYAKSEVEAIIEESKKDIPYEVIDMKDYGLMDGKTVFEKAMNLMNK